MRQIFHAYPWVHPEEHPRIQAIYREHGRPLRVRHGEVIKHGGESNRLFFLTKGLCAYYVATETARPTVLSLIIPGRVMGDITCVSGERVNVVTRALKDSELLTVPPTTLLQAMSLDPRMAVLAARSLIAKEESHLEGMVANFTLEPAARLKALLKVLILSYRAAVTPGWNVVPLLLSNKHYGSIVNLTRVSVSRLFSRWIDEGLVRKHTRQIEVQDRLFDDLYDWAAPASAHRRPPWPTAG